MTDQPAIKFLNGNPGEKGTIFAFGYTGKKNSQLLEIARDLNAVIIDVRYSPTSRVEHWRQPFLADLLKENYLHVRAFGNVNYKSGDADRIEIADFAAGLKILREILTSRNAALMCACEKPIHCHRRVLSELLQKDGLATGELVLTGKKSDSGEIQRSLF